MLNFFKLEQNQSVSKVPIDEQKKKWFKEFFKTFIFLWLTYFAMYLVRNNLKAAQPFLKEQMGFTTTQLSYIGVGFSAGYGVARTVLGYIFTGLNSKRIMHTMLMIAAAMSMIIGLYLSAGGHSIGFLLILWTINAISQSASSPQAYITIYNWVPKKRSGTALSFYNVSQNIGGALAGIVALWGANTLFGGNVYGMFIFPGVIGLIIAICGLLIGKFRPQELGWNRVEEVFDEPITKDNEQSSHMSRKEIAMKYIVKNPMVWILCLANLFTYIVRIGIDNWASLYATEKLAFTAAQATNTLMFFEIGGFAGSLLWGWVSDLLKGRKGLICSGCMVLMLVALIPYTTATSVLVIYVTVFLLGALIYGPVLLTGLSYHSFVPKVATGLALSVSGTFGYIFGDSMAKVLIARISDPSESGIRIFGRLFHGWNDSFVIIYIAIFVGIALFAFVAIREERLIRNTSKVKK